MGVAGKRREIVDKGPSRGRPRLALGCLMTLDPAIILQPQTKATPFNI